MASADSMAPAIRLGSFSGSWQEKAIGEVLTEKNRAIVLKDDEQYELVTVKRRNEGVVSRGHLYGRQILVKNYSQLKARDFVISKRQVVHGATGIVPPRLDGAIVSNEYLVASDNDDISTEFLTLICKRPAMYRKFFLSSYGVVIEKLFFDAEDWKKRQVTIPKLPEQTQIGLYFKSLDRMIGLHRRKHDKLVTLKQAMLQKMFPQDGATTPEIRFKEFSEDWAERLFGDVFSYERPDHHIVNSSEYSSEHDTPVLTANKGFVLGYTKENRTFEKTCVIFDDFTLDHKYVDFPFMVKSSAIKILTLKNPRINDLYFAFLALSECNIEAMGHARHYIGVVQPTLARIPKFAEQQRIAAYFRNLDKLIAQHATQLDKLKNLKAACLDKMFV